MSAPHPPPPRIPYTLTRNAIITPPTLNRTLPTRPRSPPTLATPSPLLSPTCDTWKHYERERETVVMEKAASSPMHTDTLVGTFAHGPRASFLLRGARRATKDGKFECQGQPPAPINA
jgi:hypothetical protein